MLLLHIEEKIQGIFAHYEHNEIPLQNICHHTVKLMVGKKLAVSVEPHEYGIFCLEIVHRASLLLEPEMSIEPRFLPSNLRKV